MKNFDKQGDLAPPPDKKVRTVNPVSFFGPVNQSGSVATVDRATSHLVKDFSLTQEKAEPEEEAEAAEATETADAAEDKPPPAKKAPAKKAAVNKAP